MATFCRITVYLVVVAILSGCGTTYHVVPVNHSTDTTPFSVVGMIEYGGHNTEYLPRTVKQDENATTGLPLINYVYNVGYGKDSVPEILPLFNPLSIVGFPIGSDNIVIVGVLKIIKRGEVLKQYSSTCVFDKNRSLFYEGDTFSELRKKGLLMVRNNIENQMTNDRMYLSKLFQ